jgi:hypothetical protein
MQNEEIGRRSRWMIRAMEWDDPRARYPNLWHQGMPRNILAFDRVASRLRIGDLIAVYYPASQRYADRAEKFLGLVRIVGLRLADQSGFAWIDLETEHRFDPPLALKQHPRRVFLCCDPGWPGPEVELFNSVFEAAVAAGWQPREEDSATAGEPPTERAESSDGEEPAEEEPRPSYIGAPAAPIEPQPGDRLFAGVGYSGDMRDPRDATWLAIVLLREERLNVVRVEATGRHGLQNYLRDPDKFLMHVEAIGLDFPFGLPTVFAESILGESFPDEGWWALAKKLEKMSLPDYLTTLQEFRDEHGEVKRLADERTEAPSPLHRTSPDLGSMTYHGIRMIAEGRSRFAVRPFESAQGKLLLEVYPGGVLKKLSLLDADNRAILDALTSRGHLPLTLDERVARQCMGRRDALEAVIAARCAANAVLTGEGDRNPDELATEEGVRVRREGWIYGMEEPD